MDPYHSPALEAARALTLATLRSVAVVVVLVDVEVEVEVVLKCAGVPKVLCQKDSRTLGTTVVCVCVVVEV